MKLQLALDDISYKDAVLLVRKLEEYIDIVELGTPFAYTNHIGVIQEFHFRFPGLQVLADYKILDGGGFMASLALREGADIVTVSASANDETIRGAAAAAKKYGGQILADTMGQPLDVIPFRTAAAEKCGADYICVHTSLDVPNAPDPLISIQKAREGALNTKLAVAGGINLKTLPVIVKAKPDIVIVGGAICRASDPLATAKEMKKIMMENE